MKPLDEEMRVELTVGEMVIIKFILEKYVVS
jgi:hypothetical protein